VAAFLHLEVNVLIPNIIIIIPVFGHEVKYYISIIRLKSQIKTLLWRLDSALVSV